MESFSSFMDSRNQGPASAPILYGEEEGSEILLPTKWEVCSVCEGKGIHVDPRMDDNGLNTADFQDDPDFANDYFSGAFDIPCNSCGGRTTIRALDEGACEPELLRQYIIQCQGEERDAMESYQERLAGA